MDPAEYTPAETWHLEGEKFCSMGDSFEVDLEGVVNSDNKTSHLINRRLEIKQKSSFFLRVGRIGYRIYVTREGIFARASLSEPILLGTTKREVRKSIKELKATYSAPYENPDKYY